MHHVKTLLIAAVLILASPAFAALPAFAGRPAFAQDARQTPQREADPIAALTAEFRALRAELSAAAGASLRLQLLVARVQAQEQRVLYFDRLRNEAAMRRSNAEHGRNELVIRMGQVTDAETAKLGPDERRQVEDMMQRWKSELALQERTLQQIQVEESDAANALAQEQSRWNDFNARLDELERSLSQR
jgi:hypothetical protein